MNLRSIILRDWKAYINTKFEFPNPARSKNIILVGAENGYGKTSLFEAVVLGLFGRDGLPLIARAPFGVTGDDRLAVSYRSFMEGVLHARALEEGRSSCSVNLLFEDDEGEPIEIRRVWSFGSDGSFVNPYSNEDVTVFEGELRKPKGPVGLNGQDRLDWYRDYVATTFLPSPLAAFFMFDGERVKEFADKDMAVQVRAGIEGLLGIPVLRELAEDLRNYAASKKVSGKNEGNLEKIEQERDSLKQELDEKRARIAQLEEDLTKLRAEQDRLTKELTGFGAGTQAQMQELIQRLADHRREAERCEERLRAHIAEDLSLAISGASLRSVVIDQITREEVTESWKSGRDQGSKNLSRFIESFERKAANILPPLSEGQLGLIARDLADCWEALWYPPPDNAAETILHSYLQGPDRTRVAEHLTKVGGLGAETITTLLDEISSHRSAAARLQGELSRTQGIGPELDAKRAELIKLSDALGKGNREIGALKDSETALSGRVDHLNKDIARIAAQMDQRQPEVRRATRALKVAAMIDELVTQAVPGQIEAVAAAMTAAHKQMAHKKDLVERIRIDEQCNLQLLNRSGRDLRELDLSAGEKQIFTQSLISAVASVSGRTFPLLVDTPLGRLDKDHRQGVLSHLASRAGQVILLSTNTEVVGDFLDVVRPHLLGTFRIRHEQDGNVGRSWVADGYFEE